MIGGYADRVAWVDLSSGAVEYKGGGAPILSPESNNTLKDAITRLYHAAPGAKNEPLLERTVACAIACAAACTVLRLFCREPRWRVV